MKVVFYHDPCADGFGAAFAIWKKHPDAQFIACRYGLGSFENALKQVKSPIEDTEVFVVDFSFPRVDMDLLFNMAGRVVWLDHHKTAFEAMDLPPTRYFSEADPKWAWPEHEVVLDNDRSGALIAWNYIFPGAPVPKLIEHISDRDLWQFKLEGSKEINAALWSYQPWTFEMWDSWLVFNNLAAEGEALLRVHNQQVEAAVRGGKRDCWVITPANNAYAPTQRYKGPDTEGKFTMLGAAVNCPPNLSSDVGHALTAEFGTYGMCWHLDKDLRVKVSLRSNGEYDVSAIAKAFGGGGHRNAAGFETDVETLMTWLQP